MKVEISDKLATANLFFRCLSLTASEGHLGKALRWVRGVPLFLFLLISFWLFIHLVSYLLFCFLYVVKFLFSYLKQPHSDGCLKAKSVNIRWTILAMAMHFFCCCCWTRAYYPEGHKVFFYKLLYMFSSFTWSFCIFRHPVSNKKFSGLNILSSSDRKPISCFFFVWT